MSLRGHSSYIDVCYQIWSPTEALKWHTTSPAAHRFTRSLKIIPNSGGSMHVGITVGRPVMLALPWQRWFEFDSLIADLARYLHKWELNVFHGRDSWEWIMAKTVENESWQEIQVQLPRCIVSYDQWSIVACSDPRVWMRRPARSMEVSSSVCPRVLQIMSGKNMLTFQATASDHQEQGGQR
jgi:hypothetical protein